MRTQGKQRINFDVPVGLVGTIQIFADMDGVTTAYWLRKALEKVVKEKLEESSNYVR